MNDKVKCAVIGSSGIGMNLIHKLQNSALLEPAWLIGTDPECRYLAEAKNLGIKVAHQGLQYFLPHVAEERVQIAFNTLSGPGSEGVLRNLNALGVVTIDLASASDGVLCVPALNLPKLIADSAQRLELASAISQLSVPIVSAIAQLHTVELAEVIINVPPELLACERSEVFSQATTKALISVGGAKRGKAHAIIRPQLEATTVISCIVGCEPQQRSITESIQKMIRVVQHYMPAYHLAGGPYFDGNLVTVGVSNGKVKSCKFAEFEGEEIMIGSAVHSAEAFVGKINSTFRLSSDFKFLPT